MSRELIDSFKAFYADQKATDLTRLEEVYADRIRFRDPVHTISGIASLRDYMAAMYDNLTECRFEYLDELIGEQSAYIKWHMMFRHPRFNNRLITVRGITHVQFDEKIFFQEDVYDMGELVFEHLPILGGIIRWIKKRMAGLGQGA